MYKNASSFYITQHLPTIMCIKNKPHHVINRQNSILNCVRHIAVQISQSARKVKFA